MSNGIKIPSEKLTAALALELKRALDSLGGKECPGLFEGVLGYTARLVGWAGNGYVGLKSLGQDNPARLLIRPAIEAMFKIEAIRREPTLIYRLGYTELLEQEKWRRLSTGMPVETSRNEFENAWSDFDEKYAARYPEHIRTRREVSTMEIAEIAGAAAYYNSHYRLYCQFTHATVHASSGSLECFSDHDDKTMGMCLVSALEATQVIGGDCPGLESLRHEFFRSDRA